MSTTVFGKVLKGNGKGKKLGFPTINVKFSKKIESGVYAGLANIAGEKYKAGVFVSPEKKLLEAHVIGFSGDLYGQEIGIEIGEKIRDTMKFESDDELKNQIKKDIEIICSLE